MSSTANASVSQVESKIVMYSTTVCPYCQMAERLLKARGVEHIQKILIDREPGRREEMMTRTGRRTVPQVFIGERHVGGFDDLSALDRQGGLVPLLQTV
jgi:glutaredoxin 3